MKPTAYLVNTSRGGTVDQRALTEVLAAKRIAGAGLDVFEGRSRPIPQIRSSAWITRTPPAIRFAGPTSCSPAAGAMRSNRCWMRWKAKAPKHIVKPRVADDAAWRRKLESFARRGAAIVTLTNLISWRILVAVKAERKTSKPAVGCWITSPNHWACEMAAAIGYDAVLIDLEHGTINVPIRRPADRPEPGAGPAGLCPGGDTRSRAHPAGAGCGRSCADPAAGPRSEHARLGSSFAKFPKLGLRRHGNAALPELRRYPRGFRHRGERPHQMPGDGPDPRGPCAMPMRSPRLRRWMACSWAPTTSP